MTPTEMKIIEIIQGLFTLGTTVFVHNPTSKTAILLNASDEAFLGVASIMTQPSTPPTA